MAEHMANYWEITVRRGWALLGVLALYVSRLYVAQNARGLAWVRSRSRAP